MVRVLIVEDSQSFADALAFVLRLDGHEVSVALSAQEGLSVGLARRPDIVVADWMLRSNTLHGGQVCRQIRAAWPTVRTIIMTGYLARMPEIAQWPDTEAILEKPFHRDEILETLNRTLPDVPSSQPR